jgi:hypothetical protein
MSKTKETELNKIPLVKLHHILKALHHFCTPHILYINLGDRILRHQIRETERCSNHQKLVFKKVR